MKNYVADACCGFFLLTLTPMFLVYGIIWGTLAVVSPDKRKKTEAFVSSCDPAGTVFFLFLFEVTLASLIFLLAVTAVYAPITSHVSVAMEWSDALLVAFTASYNSVWQWGMSGSLFDVTLNCPALNGRKPTDMFVMRDGTMRASSWSVKDSMDGFKVYDVDDSPHSVRVFEVDLDFSFDSAPIPSVFVVKDSAVVAYVSGRLDAAEWVWVDSATRTPFLEFHRHSDAEWSMRCNNASIASRVFTPAMATVVLSSISFRSFEAKNPCETVYIFSFIFVILCGLFSMFVAACVLGDRRTSSETPVSPVRPVSDVVQEVHDSLDRLERRIAAATTFRPPMVIRPEKCCVCRENQLTMIAMPCRHLALCWVCAQRAGNRCPVCRAHAGFVQETPNVGFSVFVSGVAE